MLQCKNPKFLATIRQRCHTEVDNCQMPHGTWGGTAQKGFFLQAMTAHLAKKSRNVRTKGGARGE
jgi:hypothetical protein